MFVFPQLLCAVLFKESVNFYGSVAGLVVAFLVRVSAGVHLFGENIIDKMKCKIVEKKSFYYVFFS